MTITGSGFVPGGTAVSFGVNQASAVNVVSSTQLLARVPRAIGPRSGKLGLAELVVEVTVTTASGSATLVDGYTYTLPRR